MKKNSILFFLFLFVFGFAQNQGRVEMQFKNYAQLISQKKISTAVEQYTPQKLFTIIPKDEFIGTLEGLLNNKEFDYVLHEPQNIEITNKKNWKGVQYLNINFTQNLDLKFKKQIDQNMLMGGLAMEFGDENVTYNPKTGYYQIKSRKDCLALSEDNIDWKFIIIEKGSEVLLEKIVPKEILKNYQ